MCGIVGIVNFSGEPVDSARLASASRALAHRGPDGAGSWTGRLGTAGVGLAHRRLAVLDLSSRADQPMWDADGRLGLVYNGEIYNFVALRQQLAGGFTFRTTCDSETILAAYATWGEKAWERLAGMWAFGLLDRRNERLWLVRDRFGIKPLWYARSAGELVFASELPALLAAMRRPPCLAPAAVAQYLMLGTTLAPATLLEDVHKLPPGSALCVEPSGRIEMIRWYRPAPTAAVQAGGPQGFGQAAEHLRSLLGQVADDHLVADVPVGVLLSGGVDSSVVAAAAVAAAGKPIRTFSVAFADQPAYDEGEYAAAVARHLGCRHTPLQLSLSDLQRALPDLLDALDEPFGDSSYLPTTMLSQITRQHVTVALSGDGGDELFAGYFRYLGHSAWRYARCIPAFGRRSLRAALSLLPVGRASGWRNRVRQLRKLLAADSPDPIVRHLTWARIAEPEIIGPLLEHGRLVAEAAESIDATYRDWLDGVAAALPDKHPLSGILAADLFTFLPDDMLHKVDRGSMRCALEVRVPLLDHRIVEFALGLPLSYKLQRGARKRLLRAAFAPELPEFVFRRAKMGFEVPVAEFFRMAWYELTRDALQSGALERCGVRGSEAVELLDQHRTGRYDHSQLLFALLTLSWWAGRHLTGSKRAEP